MNDPKHKEARGAGQAHGPLACSSVVAILLGATPACDLDGESIDDRDIITITDNVILDTDESLVSGRAGDPGEVAPPAGNPPAAAPNPKDVYAESVVMNGAGCPPGDPGSVVAELADDLTSFIVAFRDLVLMSPVAPPGPPINTTNCVVSVKLHVPAGWQFALTAIETRGSVSLGQGLKVRHGSDFFFAGNPGFDAVNNLEGDINARFAFVNNVPSQSTVWSSCGGSVLFAMNTSIVLNAVNNPKGVGMDAVRKNKFSIQWQKC